MQRALLTAIRIIRKEGGEIITDDFPERGDERSSPRFAICSADDADRARRTGIRMIPEGTAG